jgi:effector-binding domain-containing protein
VWRLERPLRLPGYKCSGADASSHHPANSTRRPPALPAVPQEAGIRAPCITGDDGLDFYSLADFAMPAGMTLLEALKAASVERLGPTFMHYEERPDGTLTPAIAMPIGDQAFSAEPPIEVVELPPIDAVVTIHQGDGNHDLVAPVYGQMARYAEGHGYAIRGPGRDHIVSRDDDGNLVMELQLPVTRDAA